MVWLKLRECLQKIEVDSYKTSISYNFVKQNPLDISEGFLINSNFGVLLYTPITIQFQMLYI